MKDIAKRGRRPLPVSAAAEIVAASATAACYNAPPPYPRPGGVPPRTARGPTGRRDGDVR